MSEEPDYLAKIREIIREGKIPPGSTNFVTVAHDGSCAIYCGERCDCNPDITVRRLEDN